MRVDGVEFDHAVGPEHIACGVGSVKGAGVALTENADHTARAVRIAQAEVGVLHELAHGRQNVARAVDGSRLQAEPLVDDQGFVFEQTVKTSKCCSGQRVATAHKRTQGIEAVGHVAGLVKNLQAAFGPAVVATGKRCQTQLAQGHAGQRPAAG